MLVSVIIPIHNMEEYLPACLDSVVNQIYKNIEIILVDDGSTDRSVEICMEYSQRDDRIVLLQTNHQGVVAARKLGTERAKGYYCVFVDSDDWIAVDLLDTVIPLTDNGAVDIVNYNLTSVNGATSVKWNYTVSEGTYESKGLQNVFKKMMYDFEHGCPGIIQSLCTKLIKRNLLLESIHGLDNRITMGEDAAVVYIAMLKAKKIVIANSYLYFYRVRPGSMCTSCHPDFFSQIYLFQRYMEDVFSDYDKEYRLENQLQAYIFSFLKKGIQDVYSIRMKKVYRLPFCDWDTGKRVVLYGAGEVGKSYYRQLCKEPLAEIAAWVDKGKANEFIYNRRIEEPEILKDIICDKVLIAVLHENQAQEIREQLRVYCGDGEIIWKKPISYWWENEIDLSQ